MNFTNITIIVTIIGCVIRVIFYMMRKYETKIAIPLVLYGIFEMTYITIKMTIG